MVNNIYDIPIFSSLPSIIREPNNTDLFIKTKLNKIFNYRYL